MPPVHMHALLQYYNCRMHRSARTHAALVLRVSVCLCVCVCLCVLVRACVGIYLEGTLGYFYAPVGYGAFRYAYCI